jgi:DNA-binding NarL/FixJ family response regulator
VRRLTALIPALRRRLRLERRFQDEGLRKGALAAALEVLGAAAFVLDAHGSLKHANAAGQARARAEGRALRRELVEALRPGAPSRFQLVQLALVGLAPHWLAVAERPREDAAARLARATKRWGLTARQSEVLALLVIRGDPNKTIAARLECAVSTVELHVTAILQKACADSRAGLAAKFWMEP